MGFAEMRRFRRDPLGFVENLRRASPVEVFRLPWGGWCVGDTGLALTVLSDHAFNEGMSGFFGSMLPSRPAQVDFGRAVRAILRMHIPEYCESLAAAVVEMPSVTRWPAAGVELAYRCTADVLLYPDGSPRLRQLLERNARVGALRPARMDQRARAQLLRAKLSTALTEQVRDRRSDTCYTPEAEPRDLLDAVIGVCPDEVTDPTVAQLYVLMFRSIVGPLGYSLAWSVLLGSLHSPGSPWSWPVDWVVREALRHRPVSWMVSRPVPHPTEFGGIAFQTGDLLSVSPYLLHHDEQHWTSPEAFQPDRWAQPTGHRPYVPFSFGPFTCAGAAVAHELVTEAATTLTANTYLRVIGGGDIRPIVTNAAIPRPFTLRHTPTVPDRARQSRRKEVTP
ncbi:cytochrome P450 [Nocardia sp. NBC_01730]|uniref:cytochrome P450 n=1 Tax=Nocardia sp. NBC_01730 TaxID=2975998 RepID=UPI002E0F75F5|nr:cytochrome P450 [Nocardia sp. NBC_01730]